VVRVLAALLFAAAVASGGAPAVADTPPSSLMAHAQTLLAITTGQSNVDPDTLITADAFVVDELPPFRWSGPHAASQWVAAVKAELARNRVTSFSVVAGKPIEYRQGAGAAYLVLPVTLVATAKPKPVRETGMMTYTFRQVAGDWKISSVVWTTATM
jgi:hypothetical protein